MAEELPRSSEQRVRDTLEILESISDPLLALNAEGRLTYLSRGAERLLGSVADRLLGEQLADHLPHGFWIACQEHCLQALESQLSTTLRVRHPELDRWFDVVVHPYQDGVTAYFRDVTERTLAREALRVSEERLARVLETVPDGITIVDRDGKITFANPAAERILGLTCSEAAGRVYNAPVWQVATADGTPLPEEQLAFGRVMRTGAPVSGVEHAIVDPCTGLRKLLSINAAPLRDGSEELVGMVASLVDITERRRAEEARDRLFELSLDMLCVAGFDGYFKQLNPAWHKTLGWTEQELLSRPWMHYVHPEDQMATAASLERLGQGEAVIGFENRFFCKDGSVCWISWNSFPMPKEGLLFAVARDVTARKKYEAELLKARRVAEEASEELRRLSHTDGLTGIANRRYFDQTLDIEWRRAVRRGEGISLIMADIDFFKAYNDYYGHLAGDDCLRRVAAALMGISRRAGDLVARYGGEEFVLVLPNTCLEGAIQVAETALEAIAGLRIEHRASQAGDAVSVSLGVASWVPRQDQDPGDLVVAADEALYQAKRAGRNRIEVAIQEGVGAVCVEREHPAGAVAAGDEAEG